ncbi:two-component sensor histidine kinase [Agaricicola taiwanensis]|uniref:histidine kinase n=1 Tax=Agaricicola taiwanensis TaxID=591372 RepID=A0A8J2VW50_9RHOB|nr:two-component sensor histidine kinase [Agaricicola taiwanensis]
MKALGRLLRTTAFKLALGLLAVFALAAVLALGYGVWQASRLVQSQIAETVDAEIAVLREQYRLGGLRQLVVVVEDRAKQANSLLYLLTSPMGEPLIGNIGAIPPGVINQAGVSEVPYSRADSDIVARDDAYVRVEVLSGGFRLLVGRDLGERRRVAEVITRSVLSALALVVIVGLLGGFFVARRVLYRLDAMTATSRRIMAGDLTKRLMVTGAGDEFDRLALATNAMLDRIGILMSELKEVSDNIAHDLRTPLTRLRNRAEEALRTAHDEAGWRVALEGIIEESEGLTRTFEALLLIARAEAGAVRDHMTTIDLAAMATDVVELYEPVAEEADLELKLEASGPVEIHGHRELMGQALANLLDNAIKHGGAAGGGSMVSVTVERLGDKARLVVADRGQGIPEEDRMRVLERFVRLEESKSRPGSGLGLSLAAAVVRLHDGDIELQDNAPGLRIVVDIPLVQAKT